MASIKCRKCGGITNTALCDWLNSKDDMADECYLTFVNRKWEKGCSYDSADPLEKEVIGHLLKDQENNE